MVGHIGQNKLFSCHLFLIRILFFSIRMSGFFPFRSDSIHSGVNFCELNQFSMQPQNWWGNPFHVVTIESPFVYVGNGPIYNLDITSSVYISDLIRFEFQHSSGRETITLMNPLENTRSYVIFLQFASYLYNIDMKDENFLWKIQNVCLLKAVRVVHCFLLR